MTDYIKINKKWWDTITPYHSKAKLYNVKKFKKGRTSLQVIELEELGDVKGKKMLHLLCHFGMDTLSWAREGAIATGVDLSDTSIALAKKLSKDTNTNARFICANVYDLPKILQEKFDIIFMSYGVLIWLSSLEEWAEIIAKFLKKGGIFYIVELHPFTNILSYDFKLQYDYFDKGPFLDNSSGTYANWDLDVAGKTYQWSYTMSDIINALTKAGLTIEFIHEFPFTMYNQFPGFMKKNNKGQYVLKKEKIQTPLLFSLKAKK